MWLTNTLLDEVRALEARVFYLSYAACRRWALNRDPGEPLVFSGWYWSRAGREAGPFKSQSAAWRDAYYQLGRHRAPLLTQHNDDYERETAKQARQLAAKRPPRKPHRAHAGAALMTTMRVRPQWLPTAQALDAAIKASGKNYSEVAQALGVSANTISNRVRGRAGVKEAAARAMAKAIGCAWEPLVSPPPPGKKPRGRPKGGKNQPRHPGPAARALAMHEASAPLQPALPPPNGRPHPVLGFELYSDGTSHIALKTTLPADRGAVLLRQLLDFGLIR